jgi:hypothetical protein
MTILSTELLKAAARRPLAPGQSEFDLGLEPPESARPGCAGARLLLITGSRMGHPVDALQHSYRVLGFEDAVGGDEVLG